MKKSIITVLLLLSLAAASLAAYRFFCAYSDRKRPNFSASLELYVRPGMTAESAVSEISGSGLVKNERSLRRVFRNVDSVKPGHYMISPSNSSMYVSRMLSLGWQTPVRLVLSGTMRNKGVIARKISSQMLADSASVVAAMDDAALLDSLGMSADCLLAYFIPDSYEVYWTESPAEILERLKKEYDGFWTGERREKARKQGLDIMEVSVLASIVSGETNHEPEMPSVAAVYLNRLRKGMKLQADPTVAYCFGYGIDRVLKAHLKVDSPFNTYMHHGLPPAPICVPAKAALNAVLDPAAHDYLFFCASPDFDGTHRFASTYSRHLKNARDFQRELDRRRKSQGK